MFLRSLKDGRASEVNLDLSNIFRRVKSFKKSIINRRRQTLKLCNSQDDLWKYLIEKIDF